MLEKRLNNLQYFSWILHILFLLHLITASNAFCPSKCTCDGDANNLRAKCVGASLDVVPIQLNPNVKHINLTENRITTVYYTLSFYNLLETLDISKNALETLGSKNFIAQEQLKKLYLQDNVIKKLSKEAFKGMFQLQFLDLSNNQISEIDPHTFNDLTSLSFLDLSNNILISVENNVFQNLISLEILLFPNNQLLKIPYFNNFEYLKNLRDLDLSGNLIKQIENNSFQFTNKLHILQLNGNVLNTIDLLAFDGLVQLETLDLSDNNLTSVPTEQLSKLSNLTHLSLSGNFIDSLPPVSFLNLFQLRNLQLNRLVNLIKIDSRAFIDNVNLEVISMNDNEQFTNLPLNLFHGNLNLIELNLRNNKFFKLDAIQIPLDQLKKLSLADNPFVCNCSLIWLWHLIQITSTSSTSSSSTPPAYLKQSNNNDNNDDDDDDQIVSNNTKSSSTTSSSKNSNLFIIDKDKIGCDIIIRNDDNNVKVIRKMLFEMSQSDISCPTNILTIISVIVTVIFIGIICISIFIIIKCSSTAHMRRQQQKCMSSERQNIGELIIPQKVDKYELERYLAEQQLQHQEKLQQYNVNQTYDQYNQTPGGYHSLKNWEGSNNHLQPSTMNNRQSSFKNFNSFNSKNSLNNRDDDDDNDDDINLDEDHYENFDENYVNNLNKHKAPAPPLPHPFNNKNSTSRGSNKSLKKPNIKPHIVYV